ICPMDNGNILVIAWHGIPTLKADLYGRLPGTIGGPYLASERILEIQPVGTNEANVIWQWTLWDHIVQDVDINKPNFFKINEHPELFNLNYRVALPDWIHLNGIDYNEELDQIILSSHQKSEIWIIDHSTTAAEAASHNGGKYGKGGDLLYRWGNPEAYNNGSKDNKTLFRQHNPQWIPSSMKDGGDIMVFNNGAEKDPFSSSVDIISPPADSPGFYKRTYPYGPTNPKWTYKDSIPTRFFAYHISGAQRLANGNTLICNGVEGKFFEINEHNTIVWEYINPVATGDTILKDGTKPDKNKVFKCIYYDSNYGAFKNRKILTGLPIEINSIPYSCNWVKPKKKKTHKEIKK
ncbi:MAG: aryl-sulfate sulfotransferase, partial [Bacteroidia bacterium]